MPIEEPYVSIGQLANLYYLLYFLILVPLFLGKIEKVLLEFMYYELIEGMCFYSHTFN